MWVDMKFYYQTLGAVKIVELAEMIREAAEEEIGLEVEVKHVPNPRVEKEEHEMVIENDNFRKLVGKPMDLKEAIRDIFRTIESRKKIIENYKDRFLPKGLITGGCGYTGIALSEILAQSREEFSYNVDFETGTRFRKF